MRSTDRPRITSFASAALALSIVLVLALAAEAPRPASAKSPKRQQIGEVTLVRGNGARVGTHFLRPGGSVGFKAKAAVYPLYAGDQLRATNDSTVQFALHVGRSRAYCETAPDDGWLRVQPKKGVLIAFLGGTSLCGTLPSGNQSLMKLGSYGTVSADTDPVFEVTVTKKQAVVKVRRGVLVVSAKGGDQRAVVLGRNLQTEVKAGGEPSKPAKVAASPQANQRVVGQLAQTLPTVSDTTTPRTSIGGPHDPSSIRTAKLTFTASEAHVTFSCAFDGTDFRLCSSPQRLEGLQPGSHTFLVKATDLAGNSGPAAGYSWTVDSSRILFMSKRDTNFEIYSMNTDGSDQTNLTGNPAFDGDPAWSPNRQKIAFHSNRGGNFDIYVMDADGSNPVRLTTDPKAAVNPTWSPDGSMIAFESARDGNPDGHYEIYTMRADGTNQIRLTANAADDVDPDWSPGGSRIALASNRDGNYQIYVMNADGSNQTRLTRNQATEFNPAWSPDGERLVFHSNRDGVSSKIFVMNPDGAAQTALTNSSFDDFNPVWAPDGQEVAFQTVRDGDPEIYIVGVDGSDLLRLTQSPGDDLTPDW
jgi:Tol biopolymer transport system component